MVSSISLSKFFFLLFSLPVLFQRVPVGEKLQGEGIWARGNTVLLFTKVRPCTDESVIPASQILISTDTGRSWTQRGPRLEGKDFAFIHERNGLVWLAGFHTAEFGADPFILVPTSPSFSWKRYTIYKGPSILEWIAFQKRGQLIARVRRINTYDENWKEYFHKSVDGGRSWRLIGSASTLGRQPGIAFRKIESETPTWRTVDESNGGFAVQHLETGSWRTVSSFPSTPCPGDRR